MRVVSWVAALATVAVLAGCGDSGDNASSTGVSDGAAERARQLDVTIDSPLDGEETTRGSITVRGTVTPPDATVLVNSKRTAVDGSGRWQDSVELEVGENAIAVTAAVEGSTARANDDIKVTRRRTAAQRAALRAARQRKRAAARARLRSTAKSIPPKQLQKNPDRYAGEPIVISGEIFQIQEDGSGGFLLMNTECETEYEIRICNGPTVHVEYAGSTSKTKDDFVTVYGTVVGGYEYDTAIGGSNFVASVKAEILE